MEIQTHVCLTAKPTLSQKDCAVLPFSWTGNQVLLMEQQVPPWPSRGRDQHGLGDWMLHGGHRAGSGCVPRAPTWKPSCEPRPVLAPLPPPPPGQ